MKILVTGGAGFIGTNLCLALREEGHEVIALDNLSVTSRNVPELESHGVTIFVADIIDFDAITPYFEGVDLVYHFAAMNRAQRSIEMPREANEVNITGTLNVLEAMRHHHVPKIIFVSSSSVYAGREGALAEEYPLAPPHPYGVGKLAGEHYVRVYGELFGIQYVTLRLFSVYGPRQQGDIDKAGAVAKFIHQAHGGMPITIYGEGTALRNFTYVGDVVRCCILAGEKPEAQNHIINIANIREIRVIDLANEVLKTTGSAGGVSHEPALSGDPERNLPNLEKASQLLGYEAQISFEEGIEKTYAWYLTQKRSNVL